MTTLRKTSWCGCKFFKISALSLLFLAMISVSCLNAHAAAVFQGNIFTVAGGSVNDNGPASEAILNRPFAVALDYSGNLYFSDQYNHRIRKIDAITGMITTVAGRGVAGFSGDNGPAVAASLNYPSGLTLDSAGNLYFADSSNNRIRMVAADTGIITTVAGNGDVGYYGDGQQATAAALNYPMGVALDHLGTLYIADYENHCIRKVVIASGVVATVAGNGTPGFSGDGSAALNARLNGPSGIAVDITGNIYISDSNNARVRKITISDEKISTVAGGGISGLGDGGPATQAGLVYPVSIFLDSLGSIYIADQNDHRIRKVTPVNQTINTVAGIGATGYYGEGGPAIEAGFNLPTGIAVNSSGTMYIVDSYNSSIRKISAGDQIITTIAGKYYSFSGDNIPATQASLINPAGVAIDKNGDLHIADLNHHRIRKISGSTGIITTVAGGGQSLGDGGPATEAIISYPSGIAFDKDGNLYIADRGNGLIRMVAASDGIIATVAGGGFSGLGDGGLAKDAQLSGPVGIAFDSAGNMYIADQYDNRIRKVNASDKKISTFAGTGTGGFSGDGGLATSAMINYPSGIAFDSFDNLYIADQYNNRIRKVNASDKKISTAAGGGTGGLGDGGSVALSRLESPSGVAFDSANNLYIADQINHRIRFASIWGTGVIVTAAGNGTADFSGDGGPATSASLKNPSGIAIDSAGNMYIADQSNHRIRKVNKAVVSYPLTLNLSGAGQVNGDVSCVSGTTCPQPAFNAGVSVTLISTPTIDTIFGEWSGCSTFNVNCCFVTIDAPKNVSATFVTAPVARNLQTGTGYTLVQNAYNDASDGDTIMTRVSTLPLTGGLKTDRDNIKVFLKGGYDAEFGKNTMETILSSKLTIQRGKVTVEKVTIR